MKGKRYTSEQIIYALKRVEGGEKAAEVCRQMGVSEASFYAWKKKFSGLGVTELGRLRQLEEENNRLKKLVADLSVDKHILQEVLSKKL
jgi:putative transposase